MSMDRRVKKFKEYDSANEDRLEIGKGISENGLQGKRKVKIKRRPDGSFDVISYDIVKVSPHLKAEVTDGN